ncbi:MAG: sigma-70 family RNA polymerase sigma factor, partial [Gemmatimonadota bacterium]|nr:sigma-70 family RNA polymerase sigma factor [Gemmatimonadota bacterium]
MKSIPSTDPRHPAARAPTSEVGEALDLLFRRRSGQLTAALTSVFGLDQLDLVEDVVQDAFVQALRKWPGTGVPDDPGAWILRVARNRAVDFLRRQGRWREKRDELERSLPSTRRDGGANGLFSSAIVDDELRMIFAACHPSIPRDGQVALTLRTVGGFSVDEIAAAFLAQKPTIAQRIVRAKRVLRDEGVTFRLPPESDLTAHLDSVLEVIYLMFNEGYSAASGEALVRAELCGEAIRLAELLAAHPAVAGPRIDALAALFLFQAARLPARAGPGGEVVRLRDQDRSAWDGGLIRRGMGYFESSGRGDDVTSYHLQAEIAAHHTLAPTWEETPWSRILECYDLLLERDPSPIVALNRAVALAEVGGAAKALAVVRGLAGEPALGSYHYLFAVEGDLLARLGRFLEAE